MSHHLSHPLAATDPVRHATLDLLLSRHSPWPLAEPAPSDGQLDRVFEAAMRAPDHGQMRPWRFVVIRGAARAALGEVFVRAAQARDPQDNSARYRAKAQAAPLLIAICARVAPSPKVPESEQLLAVGAAVMNMLNALHLQGFGGFWSTGPIGHDRSVAEALGLGVDRDRLLGFLYVGTARTPTQPPARPAPQQFVREWTGQLAGIA